MNAAPGPGSEVPKSSDAMPDAIRQQFTELNRALAQAHTVLMRIPELWWPCDDAFVLDLARVRNRSADGRIMPDDEKGIIDPIDVPSTEPLHQYKLVRRAVELIEPVEQERDEWCRLDVERAFSDNRFALYLEDFYAFAKTKSQKKAARQLVSALRRVEIALPKLFNDHRFPPQGFPSHELKKWRSNFTKIAKTPSGKLTRIGAKRKRLAVAEAYKLLQKHSLTRITATKGSKFCQLAALLYGDRKADLTNQCKAHIRALRKR
jgi:hypothetical protein